jgi:SulP family sulfate permease
MDTTALEALEGFHELLEKQHGLLLVCGAPTQPASLIHRSGFEQKIGLDHIFATLDDAKAWCKGQA